MVNFVVSFFHVDDEVIDAGSNFFNMGEWYIEGSLKVNAPLRVAESAKRLYKVRIEQGLSSSKGEATSCGQEIEIVYANSL